MDAWKLIRFCGLVVELHMHTNVNAVYVRGCSLSVTCQVAARLRYSSDYTRTLTQFTFIHQAENTIPSFIVYWRVKSSSGSRRTTNCYSHVNGVCHLGIKLAGYNVGMSVTYFV